MNGVAERVNHTLLDKSRAMILQSKLGKEFWGEAILCATYLLNRSPTEALNNITPAKMFFNKKPSLESFQLFSFVKIPNEKINNKFDSRADTAIMIGYTHNGDRL